MITQGKWEAVGDRVICGSDTIVNCTSGCVAERAEIEANARLMAAAPELLEACKEAVIDFESMRCEAADPLAGELGDCAEKLKAVIANATT